MESEDAVSGLIDRFYEAALHPELWRETLEACARVFGAEGALMLPGPDAPLELACSPFLDAAIADGLGRGWLAHNPRVLRGIPAMRDPARVLTEQHIFSPRELDHLPFNAEYVNAHGLRHFAGCYLVPAGGRSLMLSLERAPRSGAFTPAEVEAMERVVPHLQRAGRLALRIAEARAGSTLEAFDLLRCAGLLLDGAGAVLRMNGRAAALMGAGLTVLQGALIAQHGPSNAALGRLIGSVLGGAVGPRRGAWGRSAARWRCPGPSRRGRCPRPPPRARRAAARRGGRPVPAGARGAADRRPGRSAPARRGAAARALRAHRRGGAPRPDARRRARSRRGGGRARRGGEHGAHAAQGRLRQDRHAAPSPARGAARRARARAVRRPQAGSNSGTRSISGTRTMPRSVMRIRGITASGIRLKPM
ncbi:helix-turn-helix transcriptional regulator [Methylobacterium gregans]|uniref:helix-turn-helix transcriptional regulator n=1 Tax=Methylobacterium gregans TaxID=374424 RepID=UPI00361BF75A